MYFPDQLNALCWLVLSCYYLVKAASYQNYTLKIRSSFGLSLSSRSNSQTRILEILQIRLQNDFRFLCC